MKKVLLISHSQKAGGAERCLHELAVALQHSNFDVHVIAPAHGDLVELLKRDKIKTTVISFPWWVHFKHERIVRLKRLVSQLKYSVRLLREIRQINPDVTLTNTLCVPSAAVVSRLLSIKHVWFIHEFGEEDHGLVFDFGLARSAKLIGKLSSHVFVNSPAVLDKYKRFIPESMMSVVNYDVKRPSLSGKVSYARPENIRLILVGQINSNKGQRDAVAAVKILKDKGHLVRLFVIGQVADREYYKTLEVFVNRHELADSVTFIDHSHSPFETAEGFTIGLMCSEWEALGRVTVEYMKLGIPVIGANSSTTAKLITHGENGLLYTLRDPADLASSVERLLDSPTLVQTIIRNGAQFANENYNSEKFLSGVVAHL